MAKPRVPKKTNGVTSATAANVATESPATMEANAAESILADPRTSSRKPAIVRSEPRANIVPINLDDEIRRLAYLLSERRGFEPGHEAEDWLAAEREVRQRYHQQSA